MPLPSATQLNRMRTQANQHGATVVTWCTKVESNGALGPTVSFNEMGSTTGMRSSRKKLQAIGGGAFLEVTEEHVTLPASLASSITPDMLFIIDNLQYEIVGASTVDDSLLILLDFTIKRVKV